jgi:glycosyltransferase involved in cell wall biosynthesis
LAQGATDAQGVTEDRITIVHLAVDFNTPEREPTTKAIEWFVEELADFSNVVIAFERTTRLPVAAHVTHNANSGRIYHFPFFGLPYGLGLHRAMRQAAWRTIAALEQDGIRPNLIHAHKLTFEGLAGWYVARHYGVPLFVSLRGEVETKVFRMKPALRSFLRRVSRDAARLYFVSAWFRDEFHRYVPSQVDKDRLLPNIVRNVTPTIVSQPAGDAFVSVFNLDTWKRKGVRWLLDAIGLAAKEDPALRLDIIGDGSPKNVAHVAGMIADRGLQSNVRLVGPMPNATLLALLPHYRGLLLPSLNETFGMVYVEALFAGIPVLLTEGTAIDGYLDGLDVGLAAPPKDPAAIAAAILVMSTRNAELRANIVTAAPELFARFDPETSVRAYAAEVRTAIARFKPYE